MINCRRFTVAATFCAVWGLTPGADAAPRAKDKDTIVISGCARGTPPLCTEVNYLGTSYVVRSAKPPIPADTGVTVTGKVMDGLGLCWGTWLEVTKWRKNRLACAQR